MKKRKREDDSLDNNIIIPKFYPLFQLQVQGFLNGKLRCEKCHVIVCFEFMRRINNQNLCYACYDDCQTSGCYNPSVYKCMNCDIRLCDECFVWDDKHEVRLCRVCERENFKKEIKSLEYLQKQIIHLRSELKKKDKKIKNMEVELYLLENPM